MSSPLIPIIKSVIIENNKEPYSKKWTLTNDDLPENFQIGVLKYFSKECFENNWGNYQVVKTFFEQYSTSFSSLHLKTENKSYFIQCTKKSYTSEPKDPIAFLNPTHTDKKIIKTSIAVDSLEIPSNANDTKTTFCFCPTSSISHVYPKDEIKRSHDRMLAPTYNSNFTSVTTYLGGCINIYEPTKSNQKGIIENSLPQPKWEDWPIK